MTTLITTINELSASGAPLLWKAGWQGGLALLLALVLSRTLRKLPAQVHCWLWRLAYLKLLLAGLWLVPVTLPWLPPPTPTAPAASASVSIEPMESTAIDLPRMAPLSAEVPVPSATQPAPAPQLTAASWLLLAWMAGVTILVARLLGQWHQIRSSTSRLTILTDEQVHHALAEHCRRLGIARLPKLRIAQDSCGPFLVGVFRPVIVLPQVVLQSGSGAERDAALLHELAHIRRRDLLWNWLPAIAEAVFFFHPLVWLARREWRASQEIAADQLAITSSPVSVTQYADSLVELLAKCPTAADTPHLAISMSPAFSQLKRRMIAMQIFQPLTPTRRHTLAALVLAAAAVGIVPWKLVAQESPAGATDKTVAAEPQKNPGDESQTIRGIVVDEVGRPIAGATVMAGSYSEANLRQVLKTDSDGRFETQFAITAMPLVVAHKEGKALASRWFNEATEPTNVKLTLTEPVTFVGRVQGPEGKPISGADVRVEVFSTEEGFKGWNHLIEKILVGTALDHDVSTTTNSEGEFHFSALPEDAAAALKIRADGWSLLRTISRVNEQDLRFYQGSQDNPAVLTLEKGGVVAGEVTTALDGVSVAGLTVHLQESHNSPVIADPGFVKTDKDGRFRFTGLAKGTANVFLTDHEPDGPWTYRAAADVQINPGEQSDIIIELIKGHFVEGQVVSTNGEPVAGAYIGVYGPIRPKSGAAIIGYRTKADGKYRYHLPPGEARIYLSGVAPGYTGRDSGFVDVPAGPGTIAGPTLTVKPTIGLRGRIVESDGKPATDIEIVRVSNAIRRFDFSDQPIKVGSDGRFELRRDDPVSLAAGNKLSLRIRRPDGREVDVEVVPKADQEHELQLPRKAPANTSIKPAGATRTITIHVVDDQGRSVEGADVVLPIHLGAGEARRHVVSGVTDREGTTQLDVPESWFEPSHQLFHTTLWVYKPGRALGTVNVGSQLTDGAAENPIEVSLSGESNPSFRILDEFGDPAANVIVEPRHYHSVRAYEPVPEEILKHLITRTNDAGTVTIPAIEEGKLFRLRVRSEDYGIQHFRADSLPEGGDLGLRMARPLKGRVIGSNPEWRRNIRLYLESHTLGGFRSGTMDDRGFATAEGHAEVVTDAEGRFKIPRIATGIVQVSEALNTDLPVRLRIPSGLAHTSEKEHLLELVPATKVRGKVLRKAGDEPIVNAKVLVGYGTWRQSERVLTDQQGEFEARVLPGPVRQLVIRNPDPNLVQIGTSKEQFEVPATDEVFELPTIELVGTHEVPGQLVDADGNGLANYRIWGVQADRSYSSVTTNQQGEFVLKLPVGLTMDKYKYRSPEIGSGENTIIEAGETAIVNQAPLKLRALAPTRTFTRAP